MHVLNHSKAIAILGAGPAGLGAAHKLALEGMRPILFEKSDRPGGLARTEEYEGFLFDVGGHRFFTKIEEIKNLWEEMLGQDLLKVDRISRIYYKGRFFDYPLRLSNALLNLGIFEALFILGSYLRAKAQPLRPEQNFEHWVRNRFGYRLYSTFFKTYTEKVWGIPCTEIQAEWAVQRIKGLSLTAALANAVLGIQKAKTLIDQFQYPTKGPGMMWDRFIQEISANKGKIFFGAEVVGLQCHRDEVKNVLIRNNGVIREIAVSHVISTLPLPLLISLLDPEPPPDILKAAQLLKHRSFILVGLIINKQFLFPDQWIYIHTPEVLVGRIQNFKNWSKAMVPDQSKTSLGMEYFCNHGDSLWALSDGELIDLASHELSRLGLAKPSEILDGFVIRQADAYPVYDPMYRSSLQLIRPFVKKIRNLQTVGRNGMHRYNNMDHSLLTGIMAAENILGSNYDVWEVNEEKTYLEEESTPSIVSNIYEKFLKGTTAKIDELALAIATGSTSGLIMFLATVWLILKGGQNIGPHLSLLSQYFVGYSVTLTGAFVAFAYSFFWGFLLGWFFAYLRNLFLAYYAYRLQKKVESLSLRDFFDRIW